MRSFQHFFIPSLPLWVALSGILIFNFPLIAQEHPFLIMKREQFSYHRDKSESEPWKAMKQDALRTVAEGLTTEGNPAYALQEFIGAVALAYILEPHKSKEHAQLVRKMIIEEYSRLVLDEARAWGGVVPPLGSFFVAILSLDIVRDGLSADEVKACEEVIESQIFKLDREGSWVDVRYGTHGTWDIYKGTRKEPDDAYYENIMRQITPDGVSPVTIHYAWERVGGGDSRISKAGYMDVLEFTGVDRRYYANERLQRFHRWLFGASVNNNREMALIGDMLPNQPLRNDMLHRRVGNFDEEAAAYAAWLHKDRPAKGHIISYLLPKAPLPTPKAPKSSYYKDGGAFFREDGNDPLGIHAVLYNIKGQDEWHTHQETNGLALSGLGNRLLVNGGRLGAPTRPASLNNTLTVDGEEHQARIGKGIVEAIIGESFDYSSGDAGEAFPHGKHLRNLILVHGIGETPGYCLVYDQVMAKGKSRIQTFWHPANETGVKEISPNFHYQALIDHQSTIPGTTLSLQFLSAPEKVVWQMVPSAVPDRYPYYPDHSRLEAIQVLDESGHASSLTLLQPLKAGQDAIQVNSKEITTRLKIGEGIEDLVLEGNGEKLLEWEAGKFQGQLLLQRDNESNSPFIFLKSCSVYEKEGFLMQASHPVTLFKSGENGELLASRDTEMVFSLPGIALFLLDGKPVKSTTNQKDEYRFSIKKGNHKITIK